MKLTVCGLLIVTGLALAGCGSPPAAVEPPAQATERPAGVEVSMPAGSAGSEGPVVLTESPDLLVNTVWKRADGGPPGELRIFLADGTLVETSCVEVYALRTWRRTAPSEIVLVEDVEIPASILALSHDELRLSLALVGGTHEEVAYRRARPPFVCPELHR